jgi:hypothetical protein
MNKTLKLKHQINFSLPKVNAMYSNKGLDNEKQDPFASLDGLGNRELAKESLLIEIF